MHCDSSLFTCPQQTAIVPAQALPPQPQPYRTQPRDMHGSSVLIQRERELRGANIDQEAGLEALATGVALYEICFTSGDGMETGDNLTGQSALKCSSISGVLPVDRISAQSRSVKVILPISLQELGSPTQVGQLPASGMAK